MTKTVEEVIAELLKKDPKAKVYFKTYSGEVHGVFYVETNKDGDVVMEDEVPY